jgi:maltose alpha-D-glucosyltransferase / alpha-amylase
MEQGGLIRSEELAFLEPWTRFWYLWLGAFFLNAYLEFAGEGRILPKNKDELRVLLDINLFETAIYEVSFEFNNRLQWLKIPLQGIEQVLHLET